MEDWTYVQCRLSCIEIITSFGGDSGLGRQDLRDGIIRNPVSSFRTLEDDPLRLLRAIRFAVRSGFAIHSELADAAANVRIRDRLEQTVSRER